MRPGYNGRYQYAPLRKFWLTRVEVWMRIVLTTRDLRTAHQSTQTSKHLRACVKSGPCSGTTQTHPPAVSQDDETLSVIERLAKYEPYVFYCEVHRVSRCRNRLWVDREELTRFSDL